MHMYVFHQQAPTMCEWERMYHMVVEVFCIWVWCDGQHLLYFDGNQLVFPYPSILVNYQPLHCLQGFDLCDRTNTTLKVCFKWLFPPYLQCIFLNFSHLSLTWAWFHNNSCGNVLANFTIWCLVNEFVWDCLCQ
jgi:hypothetical protein